MHAVFLLQPFGHKLVVFYSLVRFQLHSVQLSQVVNVFGIVHSVQNLETDTFGFQFSLADKTESITVVYEVTLPDLF